MSRIISWNKKDARRDLAKEMRRLFDEQRLNQKRHSQKPDYILERMSKIIRPLISIEKDT